MRNPARLVFYVVLNVGVAAVTAFCYAVGGIFLAMTVGVLLGAFNAFSVEAAEDNADRVGPCGKCEAVTSYEQLGARGPIGSGWSIRETDRGYTYYCPKCTEHRKKFGL